MSAPTIATPVDQPTEVSTPEGPKYETIKVNGKNIQVTVDELKSAYGLHKASQMKFEDAAKMRKEAEAIKEVFSKKEIDTLLKNGWSEDDLEKQAADFLVKRAQHKSMTPQQAAQFEREQEYQKLKQEKDEREQAEKLKTQNELQSREAKLYQTAFFKDVEDAGKNTWLDLDDPVILNNIINEISTAIQKYDYDMSVTEAVKRLEEKFDKRGPLKKEFLRKLLKSSIKDIDDNDLEAFLEKGGKGVREKSVEAIKRNEAPFAKKTPQAQSKSLDDAPIKDAQYFRNMRLGRSHLNKK